MKILVACEYSGRVRDAFIARGHEAVSCDMEPTEVPGPHVVGDVSLLLNEGWDMMIAFPPCTYLTNSNAWRWDAIAGQRADALNFVRLLMEAPIPRIAIENPAGAIGSQIRRADQYVDPWMFGEPWQKRTGLWLTNLPLLVPEVATRPDDVRPFCQASSKRGTTSRYMPGDSARGAARRSKDRSRTFVGIARAMAEQWGNL